MISSFLRKEMVMLVDDEVHVLVERIYKKTHTTGTIEIQGVNVREPLGVKNII